MRERTCSPRATKTKKTEAGSEGRGGRRDEMQGGGFFGGKKGRRANFLKKR